MEFGLAKTEDLKPLKTLWKLCFGDTDQFIDFYFKNRDWKSEVAALRVADQIVSMLTMISVKLVGENGESIEASMLYGVATHPEHQKKGFAEKLMELTDQYLLSKNVAAVMLVPAGEALFHFYEKRGYETRFFVREALLPSEEINRLAERNSVLSCKIMPMEPWDYNQRRRDLLKGRSYVDYSDKDISFQKEESRLVDMDIYSIEIDGWAGCAAIEKAPDGVVIIKELLIADSALISAIKGIAEYLGGEQYLVRTPEAFGAALAGEVHKFGMLKINKEEDSEKLKEWKTGMDSYLGIAYD